MMINPWADPPPLDGPLVRQHHKVRWLRGQGPLYIVLLGDQLYHALLHYDVATSRSYPHTGVGCGWCLAGLSMRRYAYVAAQDAVTRELFVLQLPEHPTARLCLMQSEGLALRGMRVTLARKHRHPNSLVVLQCEGHALESQIPEAWNIIPTLAHLWGYSAGDLAEYTEPGGVW